MRQTHVPEFSRVAPLGIWRDNGSGIALGTSAGASVAKLDRMSAWRFIYPPAALLEGIAVSTSGRRILAKDACGAALSEVMIRWHASTGFRILDQTQRVKAKQQLFEQASGPVLFQRFHSIYWGYKKAGSLRGLEETVREYNAAIEKGTEDPMHKTDECRSRILTPPFHGIDISPEAGGIQVVMGLTLGGLCADGRTGLVLASEKKIDGLCAAGRTAVGICSNSYVSGLSLADCVFSGKRAGEHAAHERREK